ncbi:tRNA 2-thiouridine(34) synthase MnmA [Mesohalobacter halotolerans]|uniref:tRNA-specific 2-thiouridylase MnmA n=1 Tax=Mesohalobacter halotolerans TaxID=1883405 RepID=A0A4V6ALE3_9FLAO|nr:tRNA 2-thiouridine(34) synthase MnmA [Mesohalobacter halotolerans]TKS56415.1 tRNA 2-thiouridine(34) synthase MnmA [Mesohalobacter halotolerans]
MKRVVVGLSGGVDSSVAAYLCQKQGYDVIGLFMKNWHDDSVTISEECPWLDDSNDAMMVAEKLGIPFQTIDLSEEYKSRIVDYMFKEYQNGRTPNPDVLCNREIKFDVFLKIAESLGADYVATGHYCRKNITEDNGQKTYHLLSGLDQNKDQSYFLCQINQEQLSKILFPVGELQKSEVRQIAAEQGLITADKRDSQGLCFVGKVKLPEFLQQQLKPKTGQVVEIDANHEIYKQKISKDIESQSQKHLYQASYGKVVGEHPGAHFFTKGQRKGLNIGGTPEPLFVVETDVKNNIIYVGQGKSHPGLYRNGLKVLNHEIHWLREDLKLNIGEQQNYLARIRYRQPLENATLYQKENALYVIFENPQTAIAEGQFVAWYNNDELIGSGVIN